AKYDQFLRKFYNVDNQPLRLGQAFHQEFSLEKSTQFKKQFDALYQLNNQDALRFIHAHFEMT
ncbi:hypothetical protein O6249_24140, partial [Salmonella enterica subsp. enterica]|uniref:hypothetical protein n=1 Tax=Salmonella enterica TaxID=28901 RepID=UPI0022B6E1A5